MKAKIKPLKEIIEEEIILRVKMQEGFLRSLWGEIFSKIANNMELIYIKNRIIYIGVSDSTTLHFVTLNKNKYLENINNQFKEPIAEEIKYSLKKIK